MATFNLLLAGIFPLLMLTTAISDVLTMTIPNRLVLFGLAAFAFCAAYIGMDLATIGYHLALGLGVLVVCFIIFAFGWMGGGDAKIAAVIGIWLGPDLGLEFALWATIYGGGLTLLFLAVRYSPLPVFLYKFEWTDRLLNPKGGIPYGIALAAAALVCYPASIWMSALAPV